MTQISKEQAAARLWPTLPNELEEEDLEVFFFLAHGCHAALDAPKKVDSHTVDRVTFTMWEQAGQGRATKNHVFKFFPLGSQLFV